MIDIEIKLEKVSIFLGGEGVLGSQKFTWFLTVTRTSPSSMKYIQSASSPCDSTEDRSNIKLI